MMPRWWNVWIAAEANKVIFAASIDEEELQALLEDVGAMDVSDAKWILCIYDIDGSGSIERNEFLEFFVQLVQQLKSMTVQASFMGIGGTNREYVLDHEGFLEVCNPGMCCDQVHVALIVRITRRGVRCFTPLQIDIQENEAHNKPPANSAQLMSSALSGEMTGADRVEMIEAALGGDRGLPNLSKLHVLTSALAGNFVARITQRG